MTVSPSSVVSPTGGKWRGTTAAERIGPRRERLVHAAFELLGEHGVEGTTVRAVCAQAGLNPRYFYESFDDLDALIGAVYDEIMGEATRRSLAAIAAAPNRARDKTRAALDAGIRYVAEDPRRIRVVFREGGPALARRRAAVVGLAARLMGDQAAAFLGMPREDKLLVSSTYLLAGGISELVAAWQRGAVDLTLDELIDHATELAVATSRGAQSAAKRAH
jgi:AcrR family transcriptional regulator